MTRHNATIERVGHTHLGDSEHADIHASAVDHVRGVYEHRLGGSAGANEPSRIRVAEQAEKQYRLAARQAERQAILALTHQRKVSDDIARRLLREIDLVEARYR